MGPKLFLILIGLLTAGSAVYGLATGRVHTKGRRYSRDQQPRLFWLSVSVYILFSLMLFWLAATGR